MKGALCMCRGCIGLSAWPFSVFIQWIGCQNIGNASCISLPWLPWAVSIILVYTVGHFQYWFFSHFPLPCKRVGLLLARWQWKWCAGVKLRFSVVAYICPFVTTPTWFFACFMNRFLVLGEECPECVLSMHINNFSYLFRFGLVLSFSVLSLIFP